MFLIDIKNRPRHPESKFETSVQGEQLRPVRIVE